MDEVRDGVYVGTRHAAEQDGKALQGAGIQYILTLDVVPLNIEITRQFNCKFLRITDLPESDLLTYFDECFKFIDEALSVQGRKILIHCIAGVSRSASIALAYIMYKDGLTLEEAMENVRQKRPCVCPNAGFQEQLELFERMGAKIDPCNDLYRKYRLGLMANRVQTGCFDDLMESDLIVPALDGTNKADTFYKCRKCRQALFRSSSLLSHNAGQGEAAFDWRSKVPANKRFTAGDYVDNQSETVCDLSLFIEPVRWMTDIIHQLEGKLMCPKCLTKLGSFIWYGEKCPCGSWVAPAFHIQQSKVDLVKPLPQRKINQTGTGLQNIGQSGTGLQTIGQSVT